ncbi:hypothetical protein D0962_30020 [Leptolyngbyaceae cyanobacterium CCMR0082]|uniref:Uncharacterized protein n=1 Tax=Adonisia turfae CCMR0082 TaxID=2304604 RepID=A0A6M0SG42_9CYAN|nr:hypothetical protein [Adonisia turfae CCMR0082]
MLEVEIKAWCTRRQTTLGYPEAVVDALGVIPRRNALIPGALQFFCVGKVLESLGVEIVENSVGRCWFLYWRFWDLPRLAVGFLWGGFFFIG